MGISKQCVVVCGAIALQSLPVIGLCEDAASGAAAAVSDSPGQLEEVVVTAQKRSERLTEVPATVNVLTGQDLVDTQAVSFTDYLSKVPGVSFYSQRQGVTQPVVRGISSTTQTPTVGIYIDETPFGSSTGYADGGTLTPDLDPDDLQRVEVLSGPQGTLYGANALGGVIKYVTTPPDLREVRARVSTDYSQVDSGGNGYAVRGMANVPVIADQLGVRVSLYDRQDPGYIRNPTLGQRFEDATNLKGLRASALWQPLDKLTVRGLFLVQQTTANQESNEDVTANLVPIYGKRIERRYEDEFAHINSKLTSVSAQYDLGWARILGISSYTTLRARLRADNNNDGYVDNALSMGFQTPGLGAYFDRNTTTSRETQELRISSPDGQQFEWQGGLYFDHQVNDQYQNLAPFFLATGEPFPAPVIINNTLWAGYREYAGYADVRWHITSKFDVLVGGRYSGNDQSFSVNALNIQQPPLEVTRTSSDRSTTWLFNPRYEFNRDSMVYARIASGYAPGGPNPIVPGVGGGVVPGAFAPEKIINYEAGVKQALFAQRLNVAFDVFYIDWTDIQLSTQFTGGGATYNVQNNGGKAASKGAEMSLAFVPLQGLTLTATAAYVDARLTQDAPEVGGRNGDRLPRIPQVNGALGADYSWNLEGAMRPFVGTSWRYVGNAFSDYSNISSRLLLPSYNVLDLRAGVRWDSLTVTFFAKNINNSDGITGLGLLNANPPGYYSASVIQPRTFGINVTARYH